jgi:predicted small secreted protein
LNARKALVAIFALLMVSLASCGTARRAGKDAFVGALTVVPLLPLYGGATDGYTSARKVRDGLHGGAAVEVIAFPFTFFYHFVEHAVYGVIHIIDLPLCALYGAAELHPYGPEIRPLDFYTGTFFDYPSDQGASGIDATSGESMPPGYRR